MLTMDKGSYIYHLECDACDCYDMCKKYYIGAARVTFICRSCNSMRFRLRGNNFNDNLMIKLGYEPLEFDIPELSAPLQIQSEPIIDANKDTEAIHIQQETTEFIDEVKVIDQGYSTPLDTLSDRDTIMTADLKNYLSRPSRIATITWLESSPTDVDLATLTPWTNFFNNTQIKFKLNNFAFIRCDLHIKVVINASPFYYGCLGMSYQPLYNLTGNTVKSTGEQRLMPVSQRPISYIYPQGSMGAEMTLPFFLHKNWLSVSRITDFNNMGRLLFTPFTTLQSANGVSGTGVTMQVYAWADNVELSGSTLSLALQSKPIKADEYGNGPISAPASTVAKMMGMMRNVPIIGKYATATEIGANAIAGIASIFGYTNVPVIENVMPYQNRAFQSLASAEIGFPNEKLTLLAKNELTVDPTIVGAPPGDPLAIQHLIERESFIIRSTWSTNNAADDILFYSRVHPWMHRMSANGQGGIIDQTPMSLVAQMFEGWRGDIIFRFKIIASPYHKGRLIIAYDPQGLPASNVVNQVNPTSAVYTKVVDIGEDDDVEIRIPYNQALPFLNTDITLPTTTTSPFNVDLNPTFNPIEYRDNGTLLIRVLTTLTAPVLTAPVSILCYVRAADNFEFGNPSRPPQTYTLFNIQSKAVSQEMQDEKVMAKNGAMTLPNQMRINFGEVIKSTRTLLHRANHIYTQAEVLTGTGSGRIRSTFGKLPPFYGYDPNGIHSGASSTGAIGNFPFNYVKTTPIQWLLPCFIGYRGAGVWTFNTASNSALTSIRVSRDPLDNMVWSDSSFLQGVPTTRNGVPFRDLTTTKSTVAGSALTNQLTQAGLSVLCPNYNVFKFNSTTPGFMTAAPTSYSQLDGSKDDTFFMEVQVPNAADVINTPIEKYWHAGPDFQPLFFLNVPSYIYLPTPPAPA